MKEYPPESQDEIEQEVLAKAEQEYEPDEEWMNAPLGTPEPDGFQEPEDMPKSVKTDLF